MSDRQSRWRAVSDLFDALAELPQAQRADRLRELADGGEDVSVLDEVRALLVADARADGALDRSLDEHAPALLDASSAHAANLAGTRLGAYRLVEPAGSGGMGEVWVAERADGEYSQRVALKLLKRGMDTDSILRRFRQEREILARLNHPGIVRVIDGGMSSDGRPWYAMDHVDGEPIFAYATRKALDLQARVGLVARVADAVAYAHSRLVVHRDLKPGNILVDANGAPHLLDFGIAKLLEDTSEEQLTGTGAQIMSPAYAAPEQILGEPVSTATDVYALGVVLHELVTGALPHPRRSRDAQSLADEVARDTSEKASQILLRNAANATGSARSRGDLRWLARQVRGDLDLILATAMRREPERRYATAMAFADDLRHWLAGRPIGARPESTSYRLRKFAHRHRVGVATGMFVLLALLAGFGIAVWQAGVARQQAMRAELVKRFVLSVFSEQDPLVRSRAQAREPAELIAAGIARARIELGADPDLRLDVLADLAELGVSLGDATSGVHVLQETLDERRQRDGGDSIASAVMQTQLANALRATGQMVQAREQAGHAVTTLRRLAGPGALATARAEMQLAGVSMATGAAQPALDATRLAHATLEKNLGAEHAETLDALTSIAVALERLDRLDEAAAGFARVIELIERTMGAQHLRLARPLTVLADIERRRQRYDEAGRLLERAIAVARAAYGERHPFLGAVLMRQGDLLRRRGDLDGASAALAEARTHVPELSGEAAQIALYEGGIHGARGDHVAALAAFRRAHDTFLAALGADSVYPWMAAAEMAGELAELGRLDEAARWLEQALQRQRAIAGADSFDAVTVAASLGRVRRLQGDADAAVALLEYASLRLIEIYGERHPVTRRVRLELARALLAQDSIERARNELDAALAATVDEASTDSVQAELLIESARCAQRAGDPQRQQRDARSALTLLPLSDASSPLRDAAQDLLAAAGGTP